jgi:putative nucleotidyltransferase with HDIG domain
LDAAMTNRRSPSESECLEIMRAYNMFPNIVAHSIQVKNVAAAITDNLNLGVPIDRELVIAGALLHDIAKTKSIIERSYRHDLMGAAMLREMGLDREAAICEMHVIMKDFSASGPLLEIEIVHYADKRVKHDTVVSLDERIKDLMERYGNTEEKRRSFKDDLMFIKNLEKKISACMKVDMETALSGVSKL